MLLSQVQLGKESIWNAWVLFKTFWTGKAQFSCWWIARDLVDTACRRQIGIPEVGLVHAKPEDMILGKMEFG